MMALHHDAHARAHAGASQIASCQRQYADVAAGDLAARLRLAADLLAARSDEAALLLDGLLRDLVDEWFRGRGWAPASAAGALPLIEREQPLFGWRLRLALRAPDVHARLVHSAALLALLPAACEIQQSAASYER